MAPALASRTFGFLPSGESVESWTLSGPGGLVLEIITYGGIVRRLLAPNLDGKLDDVVLGFNDLQSYLAGHPYFGAITGRVAGRITGACFTLDGKTFALARNDPPNHLHGGIKGFDKRIWTATPVDRAGGEPSLRLSYRSPNGEDGYPGNMDVSVTYSITGDNTFLIETEAATDRPAPVNLTNHSYFNLAGEGAGSIADHELQIFSDELVPSDERHTLLGRLESVAGNGNDLREPRRLGEAILPLDKNHGELYLIRRDAGAGHKLALAARLAHRASGRVLDVSTTASYLQLYTSSYLDGSLVGKSGAGYLRHAAVCLECHGYPDGVNVPALGDIVLRPGRVERHTTAYSFHCAG